MGTSIVKVMPEEHSERRENDGSNGDELSFLSSLANLVVGDMVPDTTIPTELGQQLQQHGNELLQNPNIALTETGTRIARRLQVITSEDLKMYATTVPFLPFGDNLNTCLSRLFKKGEIYTSISKSCFDSIASLDKVQRHLKFQKFLEQ
jgi:hypothetical protein